MAAIFCRALTAPCRAASACCEASLRSCASCCEAVSQCVGDCCAQVANCYRTCCSNVCGCLSSACECVDHCLIDCTHAIDRLFARPYSCCLFFAVIANIAALATILTKLLSAGAPVYTAACDKPLLASIIICLVTFVVDFAAAIYVFVRIGAHEPELEAGSPEAAEYAAISQLPRDEPHAVYFRAANFWMYDVGMCLTITVMLFALAWSIVALAWGARAYATAECASLATTTYSAGAALLTLSIVTSALALFALTKQFCAIPENNAFMWCCCCCIWCCCDEQASARRGAAAQQPAVIRQQQQQQQRRAPEEQLAGAAVDAVVGALSYVAGQARASIASRLDPAPPPPLPVAVPVHARDVTIAMPPASSSSSSSSSFAPGIGPTYAVMWTCAQCTLHNAGGDAFCVACGTAKPRANAAPPAPVFAVPPPSSSSSSSSSYMSSVVMLEPGAQLRPAHAPAAPAQQPLPPPPQQPQPQSQPQPQPAEPQSLVDKGKAVIGQGLASLDAWLSKK